MSDWNLDPLTQRLKGRGVLQQREHTTNPTKKKPRKWKVMHTSRLGHEYVQHQSASKEGCLTWIDKQRRSLHVPVARAGQSQATLDRYVERLRKRIDAYWIKDPGETKTA